MGKTYIPVACKDQVRFDLLKVPDSVLLKEAQQEIGALKAYIDELEERLKVHPTISVLNDYKARVEESKKVIAEQRERVHEYKYRNAILRDENQRLINGFMGEELKEYIKSVKSENLYNQLEEKIEALKKKNSDLSSKLSRLFLILAACQKCKVVVVNENFEIKLSE